MKKTRFDAGRLAQFSVKTVALHQPFSALPGMPGSGFEPCGSGQMRRPVIGLMQSRFILSNALRTICSDCAISTLFVVQQPAGM
jgi:hypothetical protein